MERRQNKFQTAVIESIENIRNPPQLRILFRFKHERGNISLKTKFKNKFINISLFNKLNLI